MPKQTPQSAHDERFLHCIKEMRKDFKRMKRLGANSNETDNLIPVIDRILKTKRIQPSDCQKLLADVSRLITTYESTRHMVASFSLSDPNRIEEVIEEANYVKDFLEDSFEVFHIVL